VPAPQSPPLSQTIAQHWPRAYPWIRRGNWTLCLLVIIVQGLCHLFMYHAAETAMQQAALAASVAAWTVSAFVGAYAVDKLLLSWDPRNSSDQPAGTPH
jgi:hypothetical protein